jgi:cob(I)alamin adenosyltransferase
MNKGLVYVFTGEGKGKTSAAIGTAVRAVGAGMRVGWIAFYKQASWKLSEREGLEKLGVQIYLLGKGFKIGKKAVDLVGGAKAVDVASEEEHEAAAQAALKKAAELLGGVDLLVMDEVNNAVHDGLIEWSQLQRIISNRGKTHVVLTGRDACAELVETADLVTEMKKIKHPYDQGKLAVRGLDF